MSGKKSEHQETDNVGEGFKFIDLFAGMGGFHLALHNLGAKCVFASEKEKNARRTYEHNFSLTSPQLFAEDHRYFNTDITTVTQSADPTDPSRTEQGELQTELKKRIEDAIPEFDVLCGGFPCQPFSHAGKQGGFEDERGNLFFDIERIILARQPGAVFLENVRNLRTHKGKNSDLNSLEIIEQRLRSAKYEHIYTPIVWASEHGLPQHRPRLFIIAFRSGEAAKHFEDNMPKPASMFERRNPSMSELSYTMSHVLGGRVTTNGNDSNSKERQIGFTLRVGGKRSRIENRHNWDGYWVDGKEVRLKPGHGLMMQGFRRPGDEDGYEFPEEVSESAAMKLLGNSVAVPAIRDYARVIFKALRHAMSVSRG